MHDNSSRLSITSDENSTDQEQSIFDDDDSLTTSQIEESFVNPSDDEDQDNDDDSFEVLSFEAAPESSLYIKGLHYIISIPLSLIFLFFRIPIYNRQWSR